MKSTYLCKVAFAGFFCLSVINAKAQIPVIGTYNVYYGSLHNHTSVSDGTGTPDQAYKYARDVAHLDFFGLADHSNLISSTEWTTIKNAANANNQDGKFAAFYGFEWTTYLSYGHVAVVGTEDYCSTGSATSTFTKLLTWLNARNGIAFFNHPGWDWSAFSEFNHFSGTPSDKFVGMELWNDNDGFSKYYYNDGYYSNDGNKGYYDEALVRGWKSGAAGADDNHDAHWGTATPFRVGVLANSLTRTEIMDAFKARRIFSTVDKNISLSFKINGAEMGSTVRGGNVNVTIDATDPDLETFNQAVLMKNGAVLKSWSFNSSEGVYISEYFTCDSGDYLYVRVKQADGGEAISSPIWISATANQPPVVSITSPTQNASFKEGEVITVTASASDADGSVARVNFYQGASLLGIDTSEPYEFLWTAAAPGSYSLKAVAYDNLGVSTNSVIVPITVTAVINQPPTVVLTSPANNATFTEGTAVLLTANASDPGGSVAHVDFYQGTYLLGSVTSVPFEFQWTSAAAGNYTLTAIAYDNLGASTTSAPVSITVTSNVNQPPTVSLTSPANGASFPVGTVITIAATASDADGIAGVDFFEGTTLLGSVDIAPYSWSWTPSVAGPYSLTAVATDYKGASSTSAPVSVTITTVTPGVIIAPISGGSDDAEEYANKTVKLTDADIDLVYDSKNSGNQTVGLYFRNLNIPAGATINRAYIQFTSNKKTTNTCQLTIQGEKSASPVSFSSASGNLSDRTKTGASVGWSPAGWTTVGTKGAAQKTPGLTAIIQEIVGLSATGTTNNLVILITGTGTRTAYSWETSAANAAVLHVEYSATVPSSQQVMKSVGIAVKNPSFLTEQPVQEVNLQLWPNPVTDQLNLRISGDAYLEQIEIYTVQSVLMVQRKLTAGLHEASVDCRDLVPGTYIIMVKTTRGNYPLKFVRQ